MARESLVRDVEAAKTKIIALKKNKALLPEYREKAIADQEADIIKFEREIANIDKTLDESNPENRLKYDFQSGALTFESSETTELTPEPSTIALVGTGLLGALGAIHRKLFKA
jgi:PEP-CTERM motif